MSDKTNQPCALAPDHCKFFSTTHGEKLCDLCVSVHPHFMRDVIGDNATLTAQFDETVDFMSRRIPFQIGSKPMYSGVCRRKENFGKAWLVALMNARAEQVRNDRKKVWWVNPRPVANYPSAADAIRCKFTEKPDALCDLCFHFVREHMQRGEAWYTAVFDEDGNMKADKAEGAEEKGKESA